MDSKLTEAQRLTNVITGLKPAFDASLDALCVINKKCEIVYLNAAMKSLLGLRGKEGAKSHVFCDAIKLSVCQKECQIEHIIKFGKTVRFDETPATIKSAKLRALLKGTPLSDPMQPTLIFGAILSVRDTSAELLVQAKYQKLQSIIAEKDEKMQQMQVLLDKIRMVARTR